MVVDAICRIKELNELIEQGQTGSSRQLAAKAGVTRKDVYSFIRFMKTQGHLIRYDRNRETYFYVTNYSEN